MPGGEQLIVSCVYHGNIIIVRSYTFGIVVITSVARTTIKAKIIGMY